MSEELSSVDTAWLHMEAPNNLMMITGLFIFEEPVDFQSLQQLLSQRLLAFDRFRQKVVEPRFGLGSPRWEFDPHFDIANHVHRIALPAPGDQATLQALVSDLMSTPLDFSKPLWQFHLVEGYGRGCALIGRLHHCVGDGIVLMRVLLSLTDDSPDAAWISPQPEGKERPGRSRLRVITGPASAAWGATRRITGTVVGEYVDIITNPSHALDLARSGTETTMALGRLLLLPPDPKTIFKGPLEVPKRASWSQAIPLSMVKAIGRATGCTVNDVLLAAVAGALRNYATGRGQPVEGLNIRGVIPVNLRQEEDRIELGNKFGLVFLALPLGIADPLDRLMEVKRRMDDLKGSQEAVVAFAILNAIGMAPTEIENIVVDIFGAKATTVMTNVPGPRHKIYLAGAPVQQLMFWVPQSGRLGIGVSILSYDNRVWLGVATDVGLLPDPDTIVQYYHDELHGLHQLVQQAETIARASDGQEAAGTMVNDDFTRIPGIDADCAVRLQGAGIRTYAQLAASTPEVLAALIQAPDWRRPDYAGWIAAAQQI